MLAPAIHREKPVTSSSRHDLDQGNIWYDLAMPAQPEPEERFRRSAAALAEAATKVNGELKRSSYPVRQIKCECQADSLILTGVTSQYYYVQIALHTTLVHAGNAPVRLDIVVANVS